MANNFSRQKLDKHTLKKKRLCACCPRLAVHHLTWKEGWFRSDDIEEIACDAHMELARRDSREFFRLLRARVEYLDVVVDAQHEETGRMWRGTRRTLPPRYAEQSPSQGEKS